MSFGLVRTTVMEAYSVPGEANEPLPSPDQKNQPAEELVNYLCHSLILTCGGCNPPPPQKRSRSNGGRGQLSQPCCDVAQQCNVVTQGRCVSFWLEFRGYFLVRVSIPTLDGIACKQVD